MDFITDIIAGDMTNRYEELKERYINEKIQHGFCNDTYRQLSDTNMMDEYMKCPSVINKISTLETILDKYLNEDTKKYIINDYINELIPPGTKGVIRGNRFNNIVKSCIKNMNLDKERFVIEFEKDCPYYPTTERPDWFIYDKLTTKVIIGMNQLDLWNGGHQINRGNKYIIEGKNTDLLKTLCVVCNKVEIKRQNKIYKILEKGFQNNTLCYIKNLPKIINNYFI